MEELRNESYKECVVRNSNINFDGNKLIYVFYSEWNCKDSADHTGIVWCFLENTFDSEFDYSDNPCCGIYCKR